MCDNDFQMSEDHNHNLVYVKDCNIKLQALVE